MSALDWFWNDHALRTAKLLAHSDRMRQAAIGRGMDYEVLLEAHVSLMQTLRMARQGVAQDCAPWFEVQR